MCGIAGVFDPAGLHPRWFSEVENMIGRMRHRGPDEEGMYRGQRIALGVRRLRVQDPAAGSQPFSNETHTIQLIANAEIYNFRELQTALRQRGHRFRSDCDVEVIVHAYEEYGLDVFEHLDGMFALAIWDAAKDRLILARDRFGIKPLFYTFHGPRKLLVFASELNALRHVPGVNRTLAPTAVDRFLELGYVPHPQTIYREIHKLPPATVLISDSGSQSVRTYWELPIPEEHLEATDALKALDLAIAESTVRTFQCDVPVGAFLSGGLDSATIVYHLTRAGLGPIKTFSMRFQDQSLDEGASARAVADHLQTDHSEFWATTDDFCSAGEAQAQYGEPFGDPSQLPTYFLCRRTSESVVVALSGDGGDELLGGYENYVASLLAERIQLPGRLRSVLETLISQPWLPRSHTLRRARKFLAGCQLAPHLRHAAWRTVFGRWDRNRMYDPAFLEILGAEADSETFDTWKCLCESTELDPLTRYLYLDIKTYLVDNNLTKMDVMSMAHSLEVRVPLLNRAVVGAAFRIPAALKTKGTMTKVALRRLMSGRIPSHVVRARKRGFMPPIDGWLRGPLRSFVQDSLTVDRLRDSRIVDAEAVRLLLQEHLTGRQNNGRQLWALTCLLNWNRHA